LVTNHKQKRHKEKNRRFLWGDYYYDFKWNRCSPNGWGWFRRTR
jgi:hypothetical protein